MAGHCVDLSADRVLQRGQRAGDLLGIGQRRARIVAFGHEALAKIDRDPARVVEQPVGVLLDPPVSRHSAILPASESGTAIVRTWFQNSESSRVVAW